MESTSKCQNCGMKPISEFDIWDTGKKIGKPKTRCNKCSKKKNKKMSDIMTNENGIDGSRKNKIKSKGLDETKWYKFPKQQEFIEDTSNFKNLQGVPGSLKTLTLILSVIYNSIHHDLLSDEDFIMKDNKHGDGKIQTINLPNLSKEQFKEYHGCIATLTNSVTEEIKSRLKYLLNIDFNIKMGSHFIYTNDHISINISSMDGFIHTQLKSFDAEILDEKGDYFDTKVNELIKEINSDNNRLVDILNKKGIKCTHIEVDEFQDMKSNRCELMICICQCYSIKMNTYGDILQTIYAHSLENMNGEHPITKWINSIDAKKYETDICFRCPPSHLKLLQYILEQPIYGDEQNAYEVYGVPLAITNKTKDPDNNCIPIMFTHPGTSNTNSDGDLIAKQIVNGIDKLMKLDTSVIPDNITILMKKCNDNVVFDKIRDRLNKLYKNLGYHDKVRVFATRDDGSHISINWEDVTDLDDNQSKTIMISIHGDKGRDSKVVFLVGLTEGSLPMNRNLFKPEELTEVSALNVALSRSTKYLFIGFNPTKPSRYIKDIVNTKGDNYGKNLKKLKNNKLAICSWNNKYYPNDFYKGMCNALQSPWNNARPKVNKFPDPQGTYIEQPIHGPMDDVLSISKINEEFIEPENHLDLSAKRLNYFSTNVKQSWNVKDDYLKPILGNMGELLFIREFYLKKYSHDIELFKQKIKGAISLITQFYNEKIYYTDSNYLINIIKDHNINEKCLYLPPIQVFKDLAKEYSNNNELKSEIKLINLQGASIVLPKEFNSPLFKKSIDEFISDKTNNELSHNSMWNVALSYSIFKDEIYKPCLNNWLNNPQFNDITNLLKNIHIIHEKLSMDNIEYQATHSLLTIKKRNGESIDTGISGMSDILDFDNNIIYDIKVPMGAGFNNGWLSQITGYLVTPVTGSIGINLEEYKMWNKTGIIDITNGKIHYFEYDFSNKTKVDILVHILEIHDFQEDIINRLLDKL